MRHVFLLIGTCLWVTVAAGAAGAQVLCRQSAGVDPAHAEALCQALRATDAPDGLQLARLDECVTWHTPCIHTHAHTRA